MTTDPFNSNPTRHGPGVPPTSETLAAWAAADLGFDLDPDSPDHPSHADEDHYADGCTVCLQSRIEDLQETVENLRAEAEGMVPADWHGLMLILAAHYPEDVFPTRPDDPARDPGPRIVSLVRYLDEARREVMRLTPTRPE